MGQKYHLEFNDSHKFKIKIKERRLQVRVHNSFKDISRTYSVNILPPRQDVRNPRRFNLVTGGDL